MPVPYEMTISRGIILVCLVFATIVISSLVRTAEASRYHSDDASSKSTARHRHRHRHDGSAAITSINRHHDFGKTGREDEPWPQRDEDYEDAFEDTADDDDEDAEDDEDYETERGRSFHERARQSSRNPQINHHSRYEPRFSPRHHHQRHHQPISDAAYGHPPWYRAGGVGGSGSEEDGTERRRWNYDGASGTARSHRSRPGRDRTYRGDRRLATLGNGYPSRNHESYDDYEDDNDDLEEEMKPERDPGYERTRRRWRFDENAEDDSQDYRLAGKLAPSGWRSFARHRGRQEPRRSDWKSRPSGSSPGVSSMSLAKRTDDDTWTERRRKTSATHRGGKRTSSRLPIDDPESEDLEGTGNENRGAWGAKRSRSNVIDHPFGSAAERKRESDDADYRDYEDALAVDGETKRSETHRKEQDDEDNEDEGEEEEESVWKEAEEDLDDEDNTFDNTNYYKTEDEPPYKTFDDIIKSLTSEDPTTTLKPTIRRDYRNTGIEKYLKRDAYGNMYDSRNATMTRISHETLLNVRSNNWTGKWRYHERKPEVASYSNVLRDGKKISNSIGEVNSWKGRAENERKRVSPRLDETLTRTKSLEQEYDEDYENNEKYEDAAKIGGEHVTGMQADINNTEYADEDNETETEDETSAPLVASSTTTTTTTTSTTTTTTTPKPTTRPAVVAHERRDSRSYDTTSSSQSNGLQPQPVHTVHKWQSLNTRESTKDSKGHGQQNNKRNGKAAEIKEALQHAIKVSREGSCQWPRARVIPVRDVYPSPSTTYIPHCAILHRCSDDTGCCRSEALTCVPKVSHRVELYFYTTSIEGASVVEKLSFYNHTECECKERDEDGTAVDKTSGTNEHRFTRHHAPGVSPPQNIRRPPQRKPCRCPSEFTPRITPEGECQCSCFENHQNCIRTRRGKGYFSLRDRLCIQNEECATPTCEFGEYMRRQGKCPRKKDKFDAIANYPTNMNLHHRFRS